MTSRPLRFFFLDYARENYPRAIIDDLGLLADLPHALEGARRLIYAITRPIKTLSRRFHAQEADIFKKQASRVEVKPGEEDINRRGHFIDIDDSWKALLNCYINPLKNLYANVSRACNIHGESVQQARERTTARSSQKGYSEKVKDKKKGS